MVLVIKLKVSLVFLTISMSEYEIDYFGFAFLPIFLQDSSKILLSDVMTVRRVVKKQIKRLKLLPGRVSKLTVPELF